jgi:lambda family phage minor tail protein L
MATIEDLTQDLQKQSVSAQIELWELELSPSSTAYFYSGLDEDLGQIQFRQQGGGATINTYEALPIQGEGFNLQSDGPSARPKLSVANILTTFSDALGGLKNKDLIGKKIYRRRTLEKYLYPTDTSDPAVEMPVQMYFIDRLAEESILTVQYELAAPFDLASISIPKRMILGNTCSWKYKGAASEIIASDRQGACTWSSNGEVNIYQQGTISVYVTKDDEPILPDNLSVTTHTGTESITVDELYSTTADTSGFKKIDQNGNLVAPGTVLDYWQAKRSLSSPGTLSDTNPNVRRVRLYDTSWGVGTTYNGYTDPRYNEYARDSQKVWRVRGNTITGGNSPPTNAFWQVGDQCSKSLKACNMRYSASVSEFASPAVLGTKILRNKELPFGGFPGISA